MSDETVEQTSTEIPSGAELARDFSAANEAEAAGSTTPAEPVAQSDGTQPNAIPTVDPSQEVTQPSEPAFNKEHYESVLRGYADLIEQQNRQLADYQQRKAEAAPKPAGFDVEAWKKLVETDPLRAIQVAARQAPEIKQLEMKLQDFERQAGEQREAAFMSRIDRCQEEVQKKYADFKPGTPLYNATFNYVKSNAQWLRHVSVNDPKFNPVECAYKQIAHDILLQKNQVQDKKLIDKRQKSATVRPGVTAPVAPTGSVARQAASDLATRGDPIPESWIAAMERSQKRFE